MSGQFIKGQTFAVCNVAQTGDLTPVQFAALVYEEVCCMQEMPEFSQEANILTANCISGERFTGIGADEGTDFTASYFYVADCDGQDDIRALAQSVTSNQYYAVRKQYADGVAGVTTPTTVYALVLFSGFTDGGGGIEDEQTHTVTGTIQQGPVIVKPAPVGP